MLINENTIRSLIRFKLLNETLQKFKENADVKKFCAKFNIDLNLLYSQFPYADEFWETRESRQLTSANSDMILRNFLQENLPEGMDINDFWDPKGFWTDKGKKAIKNMVLYRIEELNKESQSKTISNIIKKENVKRVEENISQLKLEEKSIKVFLNNLISSLNKCAEIYSKVWNKENILGEIDIILGVLGDYEQDPIQGFDELMSALKSGNLRFKRNYPVEIIFNNLLPEKETISALANNGRPNFHSQFTKSKEESNNAPTEVIDNIAKRIWKTLAYRKSKKATPGLNNLNKSNVKTNNEIPSLSGQIMDINIPENTKTRKTINDKIPDESKLDKTKQMYYPEESDMQKLIKRAKNSKNPRISNF